MQLVPNIFEEVLFILLLADLALVFSSRNASLRWNFIPLTNDNEPCELVVNMLHIQKNRYKRGGEGVYAWLA